MLSERKTQVRQKLAQLRQEYREHLPDVLSAIAADAKKLHVSATPNLLRSLHRRLHKLAGSAGSFGFPELSEEARRLELALDFWENHAEPEPENKASLIQSLCELSKGVVLEPDTPERGNGHTAVEPEASRNLVYIVEDDHALAGEMQQALENFGYQVKHFDRLAEAEAAVLGRRPNFLIVDVVFSEEEELGPQSISRLQASVDDPLSVIFVSSRDDFDTYLSAVRAGAIGYFVKPVDLSEVVDCLESHLNLFQAAPYRILIVDDDELLGQHYKVVLEGAGMLVELVTDPRKVLEKMQEFHPEVVLLDLNLPGCKGYELAQLIRLNPDWLKVTIAYLSSEQDEQAQAYAVRHGGDDFLTKPISDIRLTSAVTVRANRARQLSDAIDRDSLTGLLKHGRIKEQVGIEVERAARQNKPVSVAMLDLDHFKNVNDSYGHGVGDKVIRALSQLLRQRLRVTDSVGRYGGEEFVAILPDCDQSSAVRLLDAIREGFATLSFSAGEKSFHVTLSAGVASVTGAAQGTINLLEEADKALYEAKNGGRNQVVAATKEV